MQRSLRRYRFWLATACLAVALFAFLGWWWMNSVSDMQATRALYKRIEIGMTIDEVQARLGPQWPSAVWQGKHRRITVFDADPIDPEEGYPFDSGGADAHYWRHGQNWLCIVVLDGKTVWRAWYQEMSAGEAKVGDWLSWAYHHVGL
jgi:hypothetical protein